MSNNSKLTPKLRFPEFQKAPAWEGREIGGPVDLLSGYPFDGPDISQDCTGARLLRGINITEGSIRHSSEIDRYYLRNKDGLEKFEVRKNDLVIGMDGSKVGKNSALVTEEDAGALLIQRVARLRTDDQTLIQFIFLHINFSLFHRYVDKINTSSGIPHISAKQIREFSICFPSPAEQQKIVDCLSSLDEVIAAEGRKLESLRAYKKGLMQQLFPRDGETTPRLRFPEFQTKGEWESVSLGQVVEVASGQVHPTQPPYRDLPHIGGENIESDTGTISNVKTASELQLISGKYAFDENDVLYSKIRPALNKVAAPDFKGICSADMYPIRPSTGGLRREYLVYLLLSETFLEYAKKHSDRSKIPKVNRESLLAYTVSIPSTAEQQRIAGCLSSLDANLTAHSQTVVTLKQHKKGLMQQLFPSAAEAET